MAAAFPEDDLRLFAPGRGAVEAPAGVTVAAPAMPSRAIFASAALTGRPRLDRLLGGADVLWIPAPAPVAISRDVPYVLTVHDLSWEERPGDFTRYERLFHGLARPRVLAERAAAVVADSAATREVVQRRWGIDARVIHPGVPPLPPPDPAGLPPLPDRFVLAVGALEPRKDPLFLVAAHAEARRRGLDADLVFAGSGPLQDRVPLHVDVTRSQLSWLYANAVALAMPSRLEGFGFPPLEAALAGTPSVVSDLPVFAETLGSAALRAPAGDLGAWADALVRVAHDPPQLPDTTRFSWGRAARELHEVLAGA